MANTLIALPRDAEGRLRLPGIATEPHIIDFSRASSVPATVTTTSSPAASIAGSPTKGTGRLALSAVPGTDAKCAVASVVDPTAIKAAMVTFDLGFGQTGWTANSLFMGFEGGTSGFTYRGHQKLMRARTAGSPPDLPCELTYWGGDSTVGYRASRSKISLLIMPPQKIAAMLIGDQVFTAAIMDEMAVSADLTAQVVAQVSDGSSTLSLSVYSVRLQQWL